MAQALYKRLDGVVCGLAQNDKGYLLEGPPSQALQFSLVSPLLRAFAYSHHNLQTFR